MTNRRRPGILGAMLAEATVTHVSPEEAQVATRYYAVGLLLADKRMLIDKVKLEPAGSRPGTGEVYRHIFPTPTLGLANNAPRFTVSRPSQCA
jgi:hypothetical protein